MELSQVIVRQMKMDLKHPFTTSVGTEQHKDVILVEVQSEKGQSGWAESVAINEPIYNEETVHTNWPIMREFLLPKLWEAPVTHPSDVAERFEAVRGNFNAKAAVEQAVWDLYAKEKGISLKEALGGEYSQIHVGVSVGITETMDELIGKIESHVEKGYKRIKVKIMPGWDVDVLTAIRQKFPDIGLMADANCAYTLQDVKHLQKLDGFGLTMIEQPLAHDDIIDHAVLQRLLKTPICLDESLHTYEDVRKAVQFGSCRIVNLKVGRVGGLTETLKIHEFCREKNVPMWCGGMLETGIGRAHNVALSTLSQFTYPGDTAPSSHYWTKDIITPEVMMENGVIQIPDKPGIGYEVDVEYIESLTERKEVFTRDENA
ncbi:o-succinylbenzoate synthase [Salimicrobium sp. PL1-032A]|uniref:o-succinylbenzoate synthase n=1 Tax=Salimicrobium sp. PL1-032A TaxID=3095364 RepID=UPI003260D7CA